MHQGGGALGRADGGRRCPASTTPERPKGEEGRGPNGGRLVVTKRDLEAVASLFGRVKALPRRLTSKEEVAMEKVLDAQVRSIMQKMKEALVSTREIPLQDVEVLMAKHALFDICFEELISSAAASNPRVSGVLSTIRDAHATLLRESMPTLVRQAINGYLQELSWMHKAKEQHQEEAGALIQAAQAVEREAVAHYENLRDAKKRVEDLEEENASLKCQLRLNMTESTARQEKRSRADPNISNAPIDTRDDVFRSSRATRPCDDRDSATSFSGHTVAESCSDEGFHSSAHRRETPPPERCSNAAHSCDLRYRAVREKRVGGTAREGEPRQGTEVAESSFATRRDISLKQLKDMIECVYVSKDKLDTRCAAQGLPKQTLAKHLDDFLLHKYGLRSMARDYAATMETTIERLGCMDNSVRVFGLILRHEVDEHFRVKQQRLERKVFDCVHGRLLRQAASKKEVKSAAKESRSSHQSRTTRNDHDRSGGVSAVATAFNRHKTRPVAGGTLSHRHLHVTSHATYSRTPSLILVAADWQAIIAELFNESDAQTVGVLVKEKCAVFSTRSKARLEAWGAKSPGCTVARRETHRKSIVPGRRISGRSGKVRCKQPRIKVTGQRRGQDISFGVFLQVILDFQLHCYLQRLHLFKEDFRKVDGNGDGVLSIKEFRELATQAFRRANRTKAPDKGAAAECISSYFLTLYGVKAYMSSTGRRTAVDARTHEGTFAGKESLDVEKAAMDRGEAAVSPAITRLLEAADPRRLGEITFSECVEHMASLIAADVVNEPSALMRVD